MRFIASLVAASVLGIVPAYAGNVCSTSRCFTPSVKVANTYVAPNYNVVQKVTDIQFVPTFVSFVPSQVLLNGQVTTYGGYGGIGYSYQGPVAQPQQPQPQPQPQPDQGQVDPNPVNVQSAEASRLDRIEKMLEQLMNGTSGGGTVNTKEVNPQAAPDVKSVKDYDAVQFLSTKCVKCHIPGGSGSEEKSKNGYTFFNADGTLKDKLNRMRIYESIDSGAMPKGGTTDPHTREAVRLWLQAGLKDLAY